MTKPDANGKMRRLPSGRAERYYAILYSHPEWAKAHYKAAVELCRREGQEITPKQASQMAVNWDGNPFREKTEALLFRREVVRPAMMDRLEWFAQVQADRAFARKVKKPDAAHEATKTYGKAAKYLDKDAPTGGGDVHNTLVVVNQLKERFTIEQLEKLLVLSNGDVP